MLLSFIVFVLYLSCEKKENKQKDAGFGPLKSKCIGIVGIRYWKFVQVYSGLCPAYSEQWFLIVWHWPSSCEFNLSDVRQILFSTKKWWCCCFDWQTRIFHIQWNDKEEEKWYHRSETNFFSSCSVKVNKQQSSPLSLSLFLSLSFSLYRRRMTLNDSHRDWSNLEWCLYATTSNLCAI